MKKDFKGVVSRIRSRIKPENKLYIKKNLAISERIIYILEQKGWSQEYFAEQLGIKTSEVSKWISGLHNITLKNITKMESVLGEDIIITKKHENRKEKIPD